MPRVIYFTISSSNNVIHALTKSFKYSYDIDNNRIKEERFNHIHWGYNVGNYEDEDDIYVMKILDPPELLEYYLWEYDEYGNNTKYSKYDSNGDLLWLKTYEYIELN